MTLSPVVTFTPSAAPLAFEPLRLPADAARVPATDAAILAVSHTVGAEAACNESGQADVFAGLRAGRADLLVPWLAQAVGLPVRLGEKVLWSARLPAVRLTPLAQDGVRSAPDGCLLLGWLRRQRPDQAVVLTDTRTDSPLYAAALQAEALGYVLTRNDTDTHLFHRFAASYAEFFNQRTSKYKNQLRKKEKVFTEQFGDDWEVREYRGIDEVAPFLTAASAINRKTYQYRLFGESVDADAASVRDGQRAAAAGRFRSFVLWAQGQPVCFVLGHQRGDGTYEHRQTGYDPAYRDHAPGIFCNIQLLQRLYAADAPVLMDFGSGDSDYKRLFSNEAHTTANAVLVPNVLRYRVAIALYRGSARLNDRAVALLERWGVKDWIKRRMRGAS